MNSPNLNDRPLSYSSLMAFKRSPAHYMHYLTEPPKETPALLFGRFFHCMILQPEKLDKKYVSLPEVELTKNGQPTAEGKRIIIDFMNDVGHAKKMFIKREDWKTAEQMKKAIDENKLAMATMNKVGQTEKKVTFKTNGIPMISYIDGIGEDFLFELKTASDAFPDRWYKDAYNYNYHIQAAIYQKAFAGKSGKFLPMRYIVIEKTAPFGISVFTASSDYMDKGSYEFMKLTDEFKYCMDNNMFGMSYDFRTVGDTFTLELPPWANKD